MLYTVDIILPANVFLDAALIVLTVVVNFRVIRWIISILLG